MNKQIEGLSGIMIKEMARDSLSQSLKKLALVCDENLLYPILKELKSETLSSKTEIKLIDYPYSILFFILKIRKPRKFLENEMVPFMLQLSKLEHPLIWNYLY